MFGHRGILRGSLLPGIGNSLRISRTAQRAVTTDEDTKSGLGFLAMNQPPTLPVYRDGTSAGPWPSGANGGLT